MRKSVLVIIVISGLNEKISVSNYSGLRVK